MILDKDHGPDQRVVIKQKENEEVVPEVEIDVEEEVDLDLQEKRLAVEVEDLLNQKDQHFGMFHPKATKISLLFNLKHLEPQDKLKCRHLCLVV